MHILKLVNIFIWTTRRALLLILFSSKVIGSSQDIAQDAVMLPQRLVNHTIDFKTTVFSMEKVVFYTNYPTMNESLYWPFKLLSRGWEYVQGVYEPWKVAPTLHVFLHTGISHGCIPSRSELNHHKHRYNNNIIDCGQISGPWTENVENIEQLTEQLSRIVYTAAIPSVEAVGSISLEILQTMMDIITYDILRNVGRKGTANQWVSRTFTTTTGKDEKRPLPGSRVAVFQEWFYPTYLEKGGQFMSKFLKSIPFTFKVRSSLKLAEFVHYWSSQANQNLWYFAVKAFKWTMQDHREYFKLKAFSDYPDTFPGTKMMIPQLKWNETWSHAVAPKEEVTLVYVDAFLALYFDSNLDISSLFWVTRLSEAWRYASEIYGPFGPDPILYVILHENAMQTWCRTSTEFSARNPSFQNRIGIDCAVEFGGWQNSDYLDVLMSTLSTAVVRSAKGVGNWPAKSVSEWAMVDIVLFDVYRNSGMSERAIELLKRVTSPGELRHGSRRYFSFWLFPIYTQYGYGSVLAKFVQLLKKHWPKDPKGYDYSKEMNMGEFLYFWSAAAGVNLKYLSGKPMEWNPIHELEYRNASVEYHIQQYNENTTPRHNPFPLYVSENWFHHNQLVLLAHFEEHIVIYLDANVPTSVQWPFKLASKTWSYILSSYTVLQKKQTREIMHMILHATRHSGCRSQRSPRSNSSLTPSNIIDCGRSSPNDWKAEFPQITDSLVEAFASIVFEDTDDVMLNIIVFDLYMSTGRLGDAWRWLNSSLKKGNGAQIAGSILWARDWHFPIYIQKGGVEILNEYLTLFKMYSREGVSTPTLNVGYIVHLWSIATGENLIYEANKAFGWTERYQEQFQNARKQLKKTYACYNCKLPGSLKDNSVIIFVLITAGILALALTVVLLLMCRQRIKNLRKTRELTTDELLEFFEGNSNESKSSGNASVLSQPFPKQYQIPRDQLDIYLDHVLGSGEFGIVYRGSMQNIIDEETKITTVAVKMVKSNVETAMFKTLLIELKVLGYLERHDHIASLLGAVTSNISQRELFIAVEFCAKGDLLRHLRKLRPEFYNYFAHERTHGSKTKNDFVLDVNVDLEINPIDLPLQILAGSEELDMPSTWLISTLDLLEWSLQIAKGMCYIGSKNIIHGDLAARNVLLTADGFAKISDFGLSRQLAQNYSVYTKKSETRLPWRWLAIESLQDMTFSVQSDVWAFGVMLYEIFTLGQVPYSGLKWTEQFVNRLASGMRMDPPHLGNDAIYSLMMNCMKKDPSDRISFAEIATALQTVKQNLCVASEVTSSCNYSRL